MKVAAIIPARYASTRLPGKPLLDIAGKTMIQRVYQQVQKAPGIEKVMVATDDARIEAHVLDFGGTVIRTSEQHQSGTDRCAEASRSLPETYGWIINVQGDEPLIDPQQIQEVVNTLQGSEAQIATLIKEIKDPEVLFNPNNPKVVLDKQGRALYFSRNPIPYFRDRAASEWLQQHTYYQHIGIYGFQRACLELLTELPPSPLEKAEGLEQLRWLENGYSIYTGKTQMQGISVDTAEDLERVRTLFK